MKANPFSLLKNFLLIFVLAIAAVSCKKDEKEKECVPTALKSQIVGTWNASIVTGTTTVGNIPLTFTEDGKLQGEIRNYLQLFAPSVVIDEAITYETSGDTGVKITATTNGKPLDPFLLTVGTRTCETIPLSYALVTITLNKK
ncbi:hypothetical protein GCM10023091_15490 [Ravibacter arvi]|uniref:Lipocalin-like domain-containing protein n=1 Tax=Ravibacter arvi TaxID=2051041 RepID=A0ABP8LW59_9BACT